MAGLAGGLNLYPDRYLKALGLCALLALLVLAPRPQLASAQLPSDFYGVTSATQLSNGDYRLLGNNGLRVTRLGIQWSTVQPARNGPYGFGGYDQQFRFAATHGVTIIPLLFATPPYAGPSILHPPVRTAAQRNGWQRFVRQVVARYGENGSFWAENPELTPSPPPMWQIWNEPNLSIFWKPRPNPRQYAQLLRISANAMRDVDPGVRIATGGTQGMAHDAPRRWGVHRFMHDLYRAGARPYFDVVDLHPYGANVTRVRQQLNAVRRVMNRNGDSHKPMTVSEVGWSTRGPRGHLAVVRNNAQQRARLVKTMQMMAQGQARWNLEHVMWFTYRDYRVNACPWCRAAGLLTQNRRPKPSWRAYTRIAQP